MNTTHLPSIELWWPRLDIPAKRWLLAHEEEPLPPHILAEISALCGVDASGSEETMLTVADRNYIATQMESVD
ncbi:hypothetical protein GCM10022381_09990 [Leifsonia kafniensis]|uniref:Uncharacterized protein n=1 Tax=Leifsonia kafniensis TaxID=475957 RepID=A0ABP7K7W6_9MICO